MYWRVVATWSDNPPASLGPVSCREMLDGVQTDGLSVLSSVGFGKQRLLKWPCTVVAWGESGGGGHGWSAIGRRSGGGPLSPAVVDWALCEQCPLPWSGSLRPRRPGGPYPSPSTPRMCSAFGLFTLLSCPWSVFICSLPLWKQGKW